jgi:hydrogenase maturation protease
VNLVIGIGNDLRGDDGVGVRVVRALRPRADVETIVVHQLVPELADRLRAAQRVLFVDASIEDETVRLDRVEPSLHRGLGHACSPAALVGWTRFAYGEEPQAWLLRIPAVVFEPGERLSPVAEACMPDALHKIEAWLSQCPELVPMMSEEEA